MQCDMYRGLTLLEHGMKVWERILDRRLKGVARPLVIISPALLLASLSRTLFTFCVICSKIMKRKKSIPRICLPRKRLCYGA